MADITVTISEAMKPITKQGFGRCLMVCTTKTSPYKVYDIHEDLSAVEADFGNTTEVYKMVDIFSQQLDQNGQPPVEVAIFGIDLSASENKATDLVTALNTLVTLNNNWFRIGLDDHTEDLIAALAEWSLANNKQLYTQFSDDSFVTDFSKNYRAILGYKEAVDDETNPNRLDAAMMGYTTTRVPGSFTFKFKPLKGLIADKIPIDKQKALRNKNLCMYINKFGDEDLGSDQLDQGVCANGFFIDDVESQDWIKYRVSQEVIKLLVASQKVPYNNTGMQQIGKAIDTALDDAFNNGIIDAQANGSRDATYTYPSVDDIPTEDKQNRIASGFTFKYKPLGAVEGAYVTGTVEVLFE